MSITQTPFGKLPSGQAVELYTLVNDQGLQVKITNYGGIITSILAPDAAGRLGQVVLGYDALAPYLQPHPYFGAIVGRYANRIAGGRFELDGQTYHITKENDNWALHGGLVGFDKRVWQAESYTSQNESILTLTYLSPDGEEGFPGNLTCTVTYALTNANELKIGFHAVTDNPTPVNLTNHTYFNLNQSTDVLQHTLIIASDSFTALDANFVPTGEIRAVEGTPFDFRTEKPIGKDIAAAGGYDLNYLLPPAKGTPAVAAIATEPISGRSLQVYATQPGVQLYTGNYLDGTLVGHNGMRYGKHAGFCLETQHYPDSPNHPAFPNTILRPGETYHEQTVFKFSTL